MPFGGGSLSSFATYHVCVCLTAEKHRKRGHSRHGVASAFLAYAITLQRQANACPHVTHASLLHYIYTRAAAQHSARLREGGRDGCVRARQRRRSQAPVCRAARCQRHAPAARACAPRSSICARAHFFREEGRAEGIYHNTNYNAALLAGTMYRATRRG